MVWWFTLLRNLYNKLTSSEEKATGWGGGRRWQFGGASGRDIGRRKRSCMGSAPVAGAVELDMDKRDPMISDGCGTGRWGGQRRPGRTGIGDMRKRRGEVEWGHRKKMSTRNWK